MVNAYAYGDTALVETFVEGVEVEVPVVDTGDGFVIAQRDLELRGPGELLGTRQTGLARMRVADLVRDARLLPRVHEAAALMLARYRDRIAPLAARWIGSDERYGRVG